MRDQFIKVHAAGARVGAGPLGRYVDSFTDHLVGLGYAVATIRSQRQLLGSFDRWMARHHLAVPDLNERAVDAFLHKSRSRCRGQRGSTSTLSRLLAYLRAQGATISPTPVLDESARAQLARRYQHYLRAERGLCATTVQTYLAFFHQFLTEQLGEAVSSVGTLSAADVSDFVRRHAHAASPGRAKLMVTALRTMLRFFFQDGEMGVDLSAAVPTVPNWRLAAIPRSLASGEVERLLKACNRETATGRRDRAVLLLLGRLGLCAGEVVALELDDIDWRAGAITVRGKKGLQHDRFPLLAERRGCAGHLSPPRSA